MESNSQTNKKKQKHKEFNLYKMKNECMITCHGKPKKRDINFLSEMYNLNYVITLLHNDELPNQVRNMCLKRKGIKWNHIPLLGAKSEYFQSKETSELIKKNILIIIDEMKNKPLTIYIHCSAGIHRTGVVLYTLLRLTGETEQSAMEAIKIIREETYNNCGAHRIKYAEDNIVQPLLCMIV